MEALSNLFQERPYGALPDLRAAIRRVLGAAGADAPVHARKLGHRVWRIVERAGAAQRTVIVKLLPRDEARRSESAIRRWLPEFELEALPPPLLDVIPADDGEQWHVYAELAGERIDERAPDPEAVARMFEWLARLHVRSAGHAVLDEIKTDGGARGADFLRASIQRASEEVERLCARTDLTLSHAALASRLLNRLHHLVDVDAEFNSLAEWYGSDVFLHGDLWPQNVIVNSTHPMQVRIVDWDRCGVGPAVFDVSTFLSRVPRQQRLDFLNDYAKHADAMGDPTELPPIGVFNALARGCEAARLASCLICPAEVAARDNAAWAWDELQEIDTWFNLDEPLISPRGIDQPEVQTR